MKPKTKKPKNATKAAKPKPTPKKNGRPTRRNETVIARIIDGLSSGTPLTIICAPDEMPDVRTVYLWMEKDSELSASIARARDAGFDAIAKETMAIADDPKGDILRDRLRVDTRLKLLAKWDPKRYGDKIDLKHSGSVDIEVTIGGDESK